MSAGASDRLQPTIAIIGSGPAGCYTAQFLRKKWAQAEITIFEALPAPYGLVRYGVAADHQGTKAVTRQFDRLFERESVRFAGNVTIGRDLDFEFVAEHFDVVVLATGLRDDRALDVVQDPAARVIGAGALVRALNGFPGDTLPRNAQGRHVRLGERLAVVGNGNVAIDVLRMLVKRADGLVGSDIDDDVLAELRPAPIRTIDVFGRSPAHEAKFDIAMLRELCALPNIDIAAHGIDDGGDHAVVELLMTASAAAPDSTVAAPMTRTRVTFHFEVVPVRIVSRAGTTAVTVCNGSGCGAEEDFEVDTVVTAIGFAHAADPDATVPGEDWSGAHVYRAGWLAGSSGAMPQMRRDAKKLVDDIAARVTVGKPGFAAVQDSIARRVVGFHDWRLIDAFECTSAPPHRVRKKVADLVTMCAIASGQPPEERPVGS
ncbi:FAD-dependent oxidoreductase [Nocardia jiangxiensis]|uniref:ferredoxin--NADP(+) reductase n=1 Tax=Nocardia jiangxiensis TaxID=282685 RepID=A0ABW6SAV9_9NOCA|nr:FAD-dependent oxidoreductase [Nocardia jiangxiensis]